MSDSSPQTWAAVFAAVAAALAALAAFLQVRQTQRAADISLFHLRRELYEDILSANEDVHKEDRRRAAIATLERCARNSQFIYGEQVYRALSKLVSSCWKAVTFRESDHFYNEAEVRGVIRATKDDFLHARSLMEQQLQLLEQHHPLTFIDDIFDLIDEKKKGG